MNFILIEDVTELLFYKKQVIQHFLSLSQQDREFRFFKQMSDIDIINWINAVVFASDTFQIFLLLINEQKRLCGIGQLSSIVQKENNPVFCELAISINEKYKKNGYGTKAIKKLLQIAKKEKIEDVFITFVPVNIAMEKITSKLGFNHSEKDNNTSSVVCAYIKITKRN